MYRTVRGMITKDELGITYIHEHLYVMPNELPEYEDFTLNDVNKSIAEIYHFQNAGGQTIVDLTPINYGRNPLALKAIADATSANIMFVTGFHKEEFQPKWLEAMTNQQIYEFLLNEISTGLTSFCLLPAALKIGTSFQTITPSEKRLIRIAASLQKDTGIPIITHCDQGTMALEQLSLLKEHGANLSKVCLSHVDLTKDFEYLKKICATGANISFDHVGRELDSHDKDRVKLITMLVNEGLTDHICLAGDMGRKKYWKSYNGSPGLDYILTNFKSYLLDHIEEDNFKKMVIDNPANILEWS